MFRLNLAAAATLAAATLLAQPAAAAIEPYIHGVITFEGRFTEGTFGTFVDGRFVTIALPEQAFRLETVLVTGTPNVIQSDLTPFGENQTYAAYLPPHPMRSDDFRTRMFIGDKEYDFGDNYMYLYRLSDDFGVGSFIVNEGRTFYNDPGFPFQDYKFGVSVLSYANNFLHDIDRLYNFTYDVQPGDEAYGDFKYNTVSPSLTRVGFTQGLLTPTRVSVAFATDAPQPDPDPPVAGAPEPATWLLLIGGFGIAGAMLRRRWVAAL